MEPSKILKFRNGLLVKEGEEGEEGEEIPTAEIQPQWEEWTNRDSQKITARYIKLVNGKVSFELKGDKKVDYPLEHLSEESRERIMQRAKADAPSMR
jgi:hypothetical protein